jgi:hypothetical protein
MTEENFYSKTCEDCGKTITDEEANYEYPYILCEDCFLKREKASGLGECNA